ncbi:MAG: CUAEP/CCAEP-tail radical SAM protein [Chloroflexi bacterium]|nr:CUAEP/CCAEP-tail radical SAM protein [Chloroflexota bacterium]
MPVANADTPLPPASVRSLYGRGRILLISCYEMGHQPMGLVLPYSMLADAGFHPTTLDLAVEDLDPEKVRRAHLVAISVPMHTALRIGVGVAEQARRLNPDCHICIHGLYASLNAGRLLGTLADSCIGGNGEEGLVSLARSLAGEPTPPSPDIYLPGSPGRPLSRKQQPVRLRRDGIPPLDRYARLERDGNSVPAGYVEASRGCLHHCRHCPLPPVYGGRFFVFEADTVLDDIHRQAEAGAAHITFGDPDFLNGPKHSLSIIREMHSRHPHLTFDATIKVEHILERSEIFPELHRSGCLFVVTAVESLSPQVLSILDKGHIRSDVTEALRVLRGAGIEMRPTWVAFTPWTTRSDYLEMLSFVEAEGLIDNVDPVQYSIRLLAPPGSLLLENESMLPHLGPLDEDAFTYTWEHPDPCMDDLHLRVAALVEADATAGVDPAETFYRVRDLAGRLLGQAAESPHAPITADRKRPPRLSEPWFC